MVSLEEQVQAYKDLVNQIAELEQKKKSLSIAIIAEMPQKRISIGEYIVRRCDRFSYHTTLEQARTFGATKMMEVLDKEVLKKLHEQGLVIPGVSSSSFIQVSSHKEILS